MIKLYRRLASRARTINRFNKTRVSMENYMTPQELQELSVAPLEYLGAGLPTGRLPGIGKDVASIRHGTLEDRYERQVVRSTSIGHATWCNKLLEMYNKSQKAGPEPFSRKKLQRSILFFSNGGKPQDKVLVFCFTSAARRMMMPLPVFLQHLDADAVDVVLLCDPHRNGYREGINKEPGKIEDMFDQLERQFDRRAYRGAVAIGTSAGGLPSVLVALRLGLDAVLCVGGNDPHDPRWQEAGGVGAAALLQRYATQLAEPLPPIFLLHTAGYTMDSDAATSLADTLRSSMPVNHIPYQASAETPVGHNVLPAREAGELSAFINSTVLDRNLFKDAE